jgi:hypothetical protein
MRLSNELAASLLFVAAALPTCSVHAQSSPLPAPTVNTCIVSSCAGGTFGTVSGPNGSGTASLLPTPADSAQGIASEDLIYFFSANGAANTLVPVQVSFALQASGTSIDDNGLAALFITTDSAENNSYTYNGQTIANANPNEVLTIACSPANSNDCYSSVAGAVTYNNVGAGARGVETFNVLSNSANEVELEVVAQGGGSASIDPSISIDPSFADASQFTLSFSPGVGNTPPVPLPAAAWLMLSGLGGLSVIARKRKAI